MRGRVDDQQVAGVEEVGQIAGAGMGDAPVAAGDEHPHVVAGKAAALWRLVRLEAFGQLEGRLGAHAEAASMSAWR